MHAVVIVLSDTGPALNGRPRESSRPVLHASAARAICEHGMLAIRRRNKRASLVAFYRLGLAIQACPFPEPRVRENVKH